MRGFPALFAPASLKRKIGAARAEAAERFSGAFCAGLIEAVPLDRRVAQRREFSGAFCAGLIEAPLNLGIPFSFMNSFSGAFCAGLIEAYPPKSVTT